MANYPLFVYNRLNTPPQITADAHQHGLMSRTDALYSIELISPGAAVPVCFTVNITGLTSLCNANGDLLIGKK